ncbi:cysteine hydrolase [Deinococcus aetherius]|uniref:Cysteine hydrolase n=1 Tax=Deinococcus aetherius TaxID=200252 RepID=A0ABN6RLD2_9DEIO|nr:cysteine hydrolase family protein [Deinococcus aetherius]BDP42689.1 cysteine hydrolase [Deinococcus aetherius]
MTDTPTPPALVLIDIQKGFLNPIWGERNNPDAEANATRLLAAWRAQGWPVFHVQHLSRGPESPLRPGQDGAEFQPGFEPRPGEGHVTKHVNSAFIGTDLEGQLRGQGIGRLVIAGLTTDHCVSTTTRMAGNLGFDVTLLGDATATFDRTFGNLHLTADELHRAHLASLHGEFATVRTTSEVLAELG